MFERYNPSDYQVGSKIFIAEPRGWNTARVRECVVQRITPTGILIAIGGKATFRISKRGIVIGESGYNRRHVVREARAIELMEESAEKDWWLSLRGIADSLDRAARSEDEDELRKVAASLAQAIEARRAATGTGAVHESPTPTGDAPKGDRR